MDKVKFLTKKKEFFIILLSVVLFILAIWGFAFDKEKEPIRVAFLTKGGGVIFDHGYHSSLKDTTCEECHHNYSPDQKERVKMNCRECHYNKEFVETCGDETIHKRCIGKNCVECHVQGSVKCEFCHNAEHFEKVKTPKEIIFNTDGGPVVFNHLDHASPDGYEIECETCHHGYKIENKKNFPLNCRRCHYNSKYKMICENADVHVRCIGKNCIECHSDGVDDCTICHKEE
ncbi:MAG: hypothetical protein KAT17_06850 [Candidatus Aminicenantes bacterium]|nr:hypothetical protein [Candidatus Aminicenantes bacterium]